MIPYATSKVAREDTSATITKPIRLRCSLIGFGRSGVLVPVRAPESSSIALPTDTLAAASGPICFDLPPRDEASNGSFSLLDLPLRNVPCTNRRRGAGRHCEKRRAVVALWRGGRGKEAAVVRCVFKRGKEQLSPCLTRECQNTAGRTARSRSICARMGFCTHRLFPSLLEPHERF